MILQNKFAIVTGASTGIGRAIATALGKEGATVALVARRIEKLNETAEQVRMMGGASGNLSYRSCQC